MYKLVTKFEELGDFVSDIQKYKIAGFDTEDTGLDPFSDKVTLIQLKLGDNIYLFNTVKLGENHSRYVIQVIRDSNILLVGHNLNYDIKMIKSNYGEFLLNVHDTMIAEIMTTNGLETNRYPSLAHLTEKYLGVVLDKSVRNNFIGNYTGEFTEQDYVYAALDVQYLLTIRDMQLCILEKQKQLRALELENKLVPVVASMELNGIKVDPEKWLALSDDSKRQAIDLEKELKEQIVNKIIESNLFPNAWETVTKLKILGKAKQTKGRQKTLEVITDLDYIRQYILENINIGSSDQMLAVLTLIYNVPVENTNEKTLDKFLIKSPIIKTILDYREHKKKVESFGEKFLSHTQEKTGRIHSKFNQLGARTGRFSGDSPNLFNIPKEQSYRDPFIAEPGFKIIATDFAQEELRLMAVTFQISGMIKAFNDNIDLHVATASGLFDVPIDEVTKEQRRKGKTLNFAVGYGSSEYGLYKTFGIPMEEGRELLRKYFDELYPEYKAVKEAGGKRILEQGWSSTLLGRKRYFQTKIMFDNWKQKEREEASIVREGINTIIQGTGADVIKESLIRIFLENPFGERKLKVILQVYDEILVEASDDIVEEAQKFICKIMMEVEAKYLKGVVQPEVESKIGQEWLH